MITELRDEDVFSNYFVNDSMFRIDPPRPKSLKSVLKGLRLADALMWAAHDFFNKRIDPRHHLRIIPLPIQIIFPGLRRKDEIHASSRIFRLTPLPLVNASTAPIRRLAFAGERRR